MNFTAIDVLENMFFDLEGLKQECEAIKNSPIWVENLSLILADALVYGEYSAPQVKQLVRELDVEPCAKLSKLLGEIDSFSAKSRLGVLDFQRLKNTVNGNAMFSIQCEVLRAGDDHNQLISTGKIVELFAVPDSMENCSLTSHLNAFFPFKAAGVEIVQRNPIIRANVSRYARRVRVHDVVFEKDFDLKKIA